MVETEGRDHHHAVRDWRKFFDTVKAITAVWEIG